MKHGPLGIHLSVGQKYDEAVAEARALGITCCQVFTHNPRSWQFAPLDETAVKKFREDLRKAGVSPVASHCNYLINLGTQDKEIRTKSLECLRKELAYADAFGCEYFVLHVGKHKDESLKQGVRNVADGINAVKAEMLKRKVMLLLETVAGQGTEIGRELSTLGEIIRLVDPALKERVGVCVDTCHVFAAGYDLRSDEKVDAFVTEIDRAFGIDKVRFIHLNDSLKDVGERRDRHVHIGDGFIGIAGFKAFLNHPKLAPIPKILETPVDEEKGYEEDLAMVRKLQQ